MSGSNLIEIQSDDEDGLKRPVSSEFNDGKQEIPQEEDLDAEEVRKRHEQEKLQKIAEKQQQAREALKTAPPQNRPIPIPRPAPSKSKRSLVDDDDEEDEAFDDKEEEKPARGRKRRRVINEDDDEVEEKESKREKKVAPAPRREPPTIEVISSDEEAKEEKKDSDSDDEPVKKPDQSIVTKDAKWARTLEKFGRFEEGFKRIGKEINAPITLSPPRASPDKAPPVKHDWKAMLKGSNRSNHDEQKRGRGGRQRGRGGRGNMAEAEVEESVNSEEKEEKKNEQKDQEKDDDQESTEEQKISFKVKVPGQKDLSIVAFKSQTFAPIIAGCSKKIGQQLRFSFDGEVITPNQKVGDIDLEEGDQVDADPIDTPGAASEEHQAEREQEE